jgi:hypothetical protein
MENFVQWYRSNSVEITWFIIGWLTLGAIDAALHENYEFVLIDMALIYVNYKLCKHNG